MKELNVLGWNCLVREEESLLHLSFDCSVDVFCTQQSVQFIDQVVAPDDFYKVLSVINEKKYTSDRIVVCTEDEKTELRSLYLEEYSFLTWEEILALFPKDLDQTQNRIISHFRFLLDYPGDRRYVEPLDCFSRNQAEYMFYIDSLKKEGFIECRYAENPAAQVRAQILLTSTGWTQSLNVLGEKAFIAMSFDDSMKDVSNAIEQCCSDLGIKFMRIDRKEHNNNITDEIILEINNSKLCIADFTMQKPGVYFEAGYAHAKDIPVIWCCRHDDLCNVHFDTRQFNHIVWDNPDDLYKKLFKRITTLEYHK
jgi:nucleoside 2-deoxyribosyltransferase